MKKYQESGMAPKLNKKNTAYHRKSTNVEDKRGEINKQKLMEMTNKLRRRK